MDPRRPQNLAAALLAAGLDPQDGMMLFACSTRFEPSCSLIALFFCGVDVGRRIYPIGRLDAESTGLLLLTSNGDCLNALLRAEEGKQKVHLLTTSQLLKSQFTEYFVFLLVLLFKYLIHSHVGLTCRSITS
jgi:hypothetical protein